MLKNTFKHKYWFVGQTMTNKDFLDYVLSHSGDFFIKVKNITSDELLEEFKKEYVLTDGRYTMRLEYQERNYLAENNAYFASKLPALQKNYMGVVIAVNGEPISYDGTLVEFSR